MHRAGVDEVVEGVEHALAQTALVVHAERDRDGLEARLVVALEDAAHQVADRMLAQVGRHIGQADLLVAIAFARPQWRLGGKAVREHLRAQLVGRRIVAEGHQRQRLAGVFTRLQAIDDARHRRVEIRPVASMHALIGQQANAPFVLGVDAQQALEDGDGFLRALELGQQDAGIAQRGFVVRLDGQHLLEALQRFDMAVQFTQHHAGVDQGFGVIGVQRQGAVVGGQRIGQQALALQQRALGEPQGGKAIIGAQGVGHQAQRRVLLAALHHDHGQRIRGHAVVGHALQVAAKQRGGLFGPPCPLQRQASHQHRLVHLGR
jgi:hypothetical protein